MSIRTSKQLKDLSKNEATKKNVDSQIVMTNYFFERLLARIYSSKYKNNFILKGGFVLSSIVGVDLRKTHDLDATINGLSLSEDNIKKIFEEIAKIDLNDGITFRYVSTSPITPWDIYNGNRVVLEACLDKTIFPLKVDITVGKNEEISKLNYQLPCLFSQDYIDVVAYDIEAMLSEKLHSVLFHGAANTRMKDYYDIYILYSRYGDKIDFVKLKKLLESKLSHKEQTSYLKDCSTILEQIKRSKAMKDDWDNYKKEYDFANSISFDDILFIVSLLFTKISKI